MWTYRVEELAADDEYTPGATCAFVLSYKGKDWDRWYDLKDARKWCRDMNRAYEITWGQDRNDENAVAHAYVGPGKMDPRAPLCARGWNRSNGFGFSIFRNVVHGGYCAVCERRVRMGDWHPVAARRRKTKWL
jgi:hypothetical protein